MQFAPANPATKNSKEYVFANAKKVLNQSGPIPDLVHTVVASVKKNLQLDTTKKEDARAAIRLAVKKELRGKCHSLNWIIC
ncbi:MAG: hypothetical protein CL868_08555 [Cytophagaceae bacterium]|nr:hypothetical protein [Cytophagaceae bacterium]